MNGRGHAAFAMQRKFAIWQRDAPQTDGLKMITEHSKFTQINTNRC